MIPLVAGTGTFLFVVGVGLMIPALMDPGHENSGLYYITGLVMASVGSGLVAYGVTT